MFNKIKKSIIRNKECILVVVIIIALCHGAMHFFFGGMWDEKYDASMSPIDQSPTVTVEGKTYALLPAFEDEEEALETFKKVMPRFITNVRRFTGVGDLTEENLEEFNHAYSRYIQNFPRMKDGDRWSEAFSDMSKSFASYKKYFRNNLKNDMVYEYIAECERLGETPKEYIIRGYLE